MFDFCRVCGNSSGSCARPDCPRGKNRIVLTSSNGPTVVVHSSAPDVLESGDFVLPPVKGKGRKRLLAQICREEFSTPGGRCVLCEDSGLISCADGVARHCICPAGRVLKWKETR